MSGLKGLNHSVKKLHPRIDYIFRIRAWNEYGCSEPSLPVSFYRPVRKYISLKAQKKQTAKKLTSAEFQKTVYLEYVLGMSMDAVIPVSLCLKAKKSRQ